MLSQQEQHLLSGVKDIQSGFEELAELLEEGCSIAPAKLSFRRKVIKVLSVAKEILGTDELTNITKAYTNLQNDHLAL